MSAHATIVAVVLLSACSGGTSVDPPNDGGDTDVRVVDSAAESHAAPIENLRVLHVGHTSVEIVWTPPLGEAPAFYVVQVGDTERRVIGHYATAGLLNPNTNYEIGVRAVYDDLSRSRAAVVPIRTASVPPPDQLPVIPGPTGHGMSGPIARDRPIFRVTNLDARGNGSLYQAGRDAAEAGGGTIVFEVSGVIDGDGDEITVRADNLVIAGQTAPPPGIYVRGELRVSGRDIVIRHMGAFNPGDGEAVDAIAAYGHNAGATPGRLVLDHVAALGAIDENLDIVHYDGGAVTAQWSLVGAPVTTGHSSGGNHAFNALLTNGRYGGSASITLRQMFFTTARDRQPRSLFHHMELINSIFDHRSSRFIYLSNTDGDSSLNDIVANLFFDTLESPNGVLLCADEGDAMLAASRIYLANNEWNRGESSEQWNWTHDCRERNRANAPTGASVQDAIPMEADELPQTVLPLVGPHPRTRPAFVQSLINSYGTDGRDFFTRFSDLTEDTEVEGTTRAFELNGDPHEVETNGYTRLENALHRAALDLQ